MPADQERTVSIVFDSADSVAAQPPVRWAIKELVRALGEQKIPAQVIDGLNAAGPGPSVVIGSGQSAVARNLLAGAGISLTEEPEALALVPKTADGPQVVLATGNDVRGLVYATLELADRVRCTADGASALESLRVEAPVVERPANRIRSVMRLFTSDIEDLGWYHDRGFWREYLSEMVAQRFNRFQLAFGIGFDFARRMRDTYFYFPYPFLLAVPRYDVRATNLTEAEQVRNLATLRFIAAETKRRGLHFQLGVWANVYTFEDSPEANYQIEGLTPETHAPYCQDALRMLLQEVPDIDGVTLRIHGESGVPEGSYDFWRTLLSGIATCGRRVEIDMHAKGIDRRMIELGLETGQPLLVSPKFWAEHLGLPYHQAEIRAQEQPGEATGQHARLMALSVGSRRFTRYGYADLLNQDREHGVLFRIWPGTNRLLLWGDPATGRGYGSAFSFGGANGVEIFEPLSFSGRRGSGLPDGRNPYASEDLRPEGPHGEWKKYRYEYRLWGRLTYNPDAEAEQWRRYVRRQFGEGALAAETALGNASRILPLVTSAHHPSAANNAYWPEIYTNMPIVDDGSSESGVRRHPYGDTPNPKRFGTVSALDPELFSSVEEAVDEALSGEWSGRYTPLEVARWLEGLAQEAVRHLQEASVRVPDRQAPEFRRWAIDIQIEAALGRFFAEKLRAAVGYATYTRTGDVAPLREAVAHYRAARAAWLEAVEQATGVYKPDLTFGPEAHLRGHWADRLPAIDEDLQAMEDVLRREEGEGQGSGARGQGANQTSTGSGRRTDVVEAARPQVVLEHEPVERFTPGEAVAVVAESPDGERIAQVTLRYRHVSQAERWQGVQMRREGARLVGEIPGEYTDSAYPLQYYFVIRDEAGRASLWPGFAPDLSNQPYIVTQLRYRAPSRLVGDDAAPDQV